MRALFIFSGKNDELVTVEEFVMQKCLEVDTDREGENVKYLQLMDGGGWQVFSRYSTPSRFSLLCNQLFAGLAL